MIILEKPYVSDILLDSIRELGVTVLDNEAARRLGVPKQQLLDEETFIQEYSSPTALPLYTNSEDSLPWIQRHLSFSKLPERIELFKNKAKFRDLLQTLYPDFWYKEIAAKDLPLVNHSDLPYPFILKPSTGFLSLGVFKIGNSVEWEAALAKIKPLLSQNQHPYPSEVVNFDKFILEEFIEGQEYAVDAYYNTSGQPVILDILKHEFTSATDVRDRLYYTSKTIIEQNLGRFQGFLNRIGELVSLKNLPLHVEVRVTESGRIYPIEFNPMRFAGWCTTDLAYYAYGINVYEYFWQNKAVDWNQCLKDKDGKLFSIVVGDVPNTQGRISDIDYTGFASHFARPLAIRKLDYQKYSLFAFAFIETDEDQREELEWVQQTDYREFITYEDV